VDRGFERLREAYARALAAALHHRRTFAAAFAAFVLVSLALVPLLGRDFFPTVDAGQLRLHVRAPPGTRIEETERLFGAVEDRVRKIIPADELDTVIDDIGVPVSGINLTLGDPSMISSADGEMLISLQPRHHPTAAYARTLRAQLAEAFPDATFFFLPADISSQILDFGLSAPIDVRLTGPAGNQAANLRIARELASRMATIPGAADVHLAQVTDTPELFVQVDRTAANDVGLTLRDVASDLLVSLASSSQTAPNFWMDPKTGVQYTVAVQTPQVRVDSIHALEATPLNVFEREIEADVLPYAGASGLTVLSYGALCRGLLSGRMTAQTRFEGDDLRKVDPKFQGERFRQYLAAVDELKSLARERFGKSVLALAVRWVLDQGKTIALWGARRPDQLDPIDEIEGWHVDEAAKREIDAILKRCVRDPASPAFMAPPARRPAGISTT